MAKAFSVLSWNVEHFKGRPERCSRVVDLIKDRNPDVIALYEVEGSEVFREVSRKLTSYQFHITEGRQVQEILVGVRGRIPAFFTQKVAFKSGVSTLRPGAVLTVTIDSVDYTMLFLHTKSGPDPRGFGIRDHMLIRATKFQKTLDRAVGGTANFIFLGDLNTMGMKYPYGRAVPATDEMRRLRAQASRRGMRVLQKDQDATWWNGPGSRFPPSDLDHVVATKHLNFRQFSGSDVTVLGWPKVRADDGDAAAGTWIDRFSDHGLLSFEVQKV